MSSPDAEPLSLSKEQAEKIIRKHVAGHGQSLVRLITEIKNKGYSYTANARTYILDLSHVDQDDNTPPSCSCFVTIERPNAEEHGDYRPNSLPVVHKVISHIRSHTDIPIPDSTLDTTLELAPFNILLSPASPITSADIIPLSTARKSGFLSPEDAVLVDLQIGKFLGQLHSGVQNDWFGLARLDEPREPSYSWQETFTHLLETLLHEFQSAGVELPYEDIRRYLSRAIGFFLFDDVEVPSLIWLTGSEDDIYISLPSHPATKTHGIAAILPNVAHALWGDPLLESFFLPPAPSTALVEGYTGSGGRRLITFPRQKTKRIWYSLFLALIVLKERRSEATALSEGDQSWALDTIQKSVEALANAPCY
ncbi:hypothetical protein BDZ97DRAFT_1907154 [Flammula alnicola]|nr:hypothetical protein BDZ97DRAFT_1907154 [Flammula alnicola]